MSNLIPVRSIQASVIRRLPLCVLGALLLFGMATANAQPSAFLGFENASDASCFSGDGTLTIVPSNGGTLSVPSFDGSHHAEITNLDDAYQAPGYGDSKFTFFCLPASGLYQGDFSQTVSVYINANWAPAAAAGVASFWIDESPRDNAGLVADGDTPDGQSLYTAEHNFRFTATGSSVQVAADDQPTFLTITTSGWYTFQLTWRKDAAPANPVLSDFNVYDAVGNLVGTTTRAAFQVGPAPPLPSSKLGGSGYLWFTVWQNHFANDVLAIDDAIVGSTAPPAPPFQMFIPDWWWFAFNPN